MVQMVNFSETGTDVVHRVFWKGGGWQQGEFLKYKFKHKQVQVFWKRDANHHGKMIYDTGIEPLEVIS